MMKSKVEIDRKVFIYGRGALLPNDNAQFVRNSAFLLTAFSQQQDGNDSSKLPNRSKNRHF
ncbi:hypothetical protein CKO09_00075 [Chromatium weissei]|nr:hypothetical protein [Chromatium weissei]